jgi:hypothetical protein
LLAVASISASGAVLNGTFPKRQEQGLGSPFCRPLKIFRNRDRGVPENKKGK